MNNGKYSSRNRQRRLKKRQFLVIASLALLLVGMVGGSLAFLLSSTEAVNNTFTPAQVPPTIAETFNDNLKSNVTVINHGEVAAFIRAAVIVNWLDENGDIAGNPEGHTHELDLNLTATGWFDGGDGYYYHKAPVAANGGETEVLITSAKPTAGKQYKLQVEIAAQTIQTVPTTVVEAKWPAVAVSGGNLTRK